MIENICIVFLFVIEFISFVYAGERLRFYDKIMKKLPSEITKKDKNAVFNGLIGRLISGIFYVIFLIYCLFTTQLFWYSATTILLLIIFTRIMDKLIVKENTLNKIILLLRIESIIIMLIWLSPFLKIIEVAFNV